jgi:hypothetical protein
MTLTIGLERSPGYVPGVPGKWRRKLRQLAGPIASVVAFVVTSGIKPHKASLKRLADMPLTVVGTGAVDFAAFHVAHGWGWLVTGVSLMVLEHLIADSE